MIEETAMLRRALLGLLLTGCSAPLFAQTAPRHLLGSCASPLDGSSPERRENIRLAVSKINGLTLSPGEIFSFNRTVGRRERARGFLPAPAIMHESLRPVIGGGICQAASTLFNAALLSDLKIVERHKHSTPVNYLPLGMDATINWGTMDLRIQNSSRSHVQIRGAVVHNLLTFEIFGDLPLEHELRLETEYHESPSPFPGEESEPGMEILLYRVRSERGRIIEREWIHSDFYPARTVVGS